MRKGGGGEFAVRTLPLGRETQLTRQDFKDVATQPIAVIATFSLVASALEKQVRPLRACADPPEWRRGVQPVAVDPGRGVNSQVVVLLQL